MKEIAELHKEIDRLDSLLVAASVKNGKPITCMGKHCCACCYEPVYCSSEEVKHMLENTTDEQKLVVANRLRLALDVAKASGIFQHDLPPVMDWLALKIPCPFLEFGVCMVYDRRPVSCRSHMAVGPAELCAINRPAQKYPMAKEHSKACGEAIINAHLKLGNTLTQDNLLAMLSGELLGQPLETASGSKIEFKD